MRLSTWASGAELNLPATKNRSSHGKAAKPLGSSMRRPIYPIPRLLGMAQGDYTLRRPSMSSSPEEPSPPEPPRTRTEDNLPAVSKLRRFLIGKPRNVQDPRVFHTLSLIAFLAWVGLGADGLSSSSYGPSESFMVLSRACEGLPGCDRRYLSVLLALATTLTVFIISYAYSRIIEHFPFGGGGYVVASRLLGRNAGVVSGSALIVDYVLTITTSIAAGADAIYDFLPPEWSRGKLIAEFAVIGILVLMNLRGVRESVTVLTPIFLTFVATHVVLILGVVISRWGDFHVVTTEFTQGLHRDMSLIGFAGVAALFLRAYSMGAGTYTGIEAVSNGLMIMREPKVETGKRTMALMAVSLALTAGGITLGYLLMDVHPEPGQTMNGVLAQHFMGAWTVGGVHIGKGMVVLTLLAEALLLFVAAQTGFIDGPRVMANMASDSWLPHRFAQLSDRLTMQNGVVLMGGASLLALLYTRGDVTTLVLMYSINVFVTFSLTEMSMCRFWFKGRDKHPDWKKHISVHITGLTLCLTILVVNIYEKFWEGGWLTLAVTSLLIGLCFLIRAHYQSVQRNLKRLDQEFPLQIEPSKSEPRALEPRQPTAVLLVGAYAGLGIHSLLTIQRLFPNYYKNFVFISVGVIDSATFKNIDEVEEVKERTETALARYVALAHSFGLAAECRFSIGTEAVAEAVKLCVAVSKDYPRAMFFAGKLIFEDEKWYQRFLHNETAYQLQRRLQFSGLNAMVLPVRVLEAGPNKAA